MQATPSPPPGSLASCLYRFAPFDAYLQEGSWALPWRLPHQRHSTPAAASAGCSSALDRAFTQQLGLRRAREGRPCQVLASLTAFLCCMHKKRLFTKRSNARARTRPSPPHPHTLAGECPPPHRSNPREVTSAATGRDSARGARKSSKYCIWIRGCIPLHTMRANAARATRELAASEATARARHDGRTRFRIDPYCCCHKILV